MSRKVSANGINFIKNLEGYRAAPYLCSASKKTIGYGHVMLKGETFTQLSLEQAEQLLINDCKNPENCINTFVTAPLNQNQFDALISFIFNVGITAFKNSTLLKFLNDEDYECAAEEFSKWIYAGKPPQKINGLINRREKEKQLFLKR